MKLSEISDRKTLRRSTGKALQLVLIAALTLEATALFQYFYTQRGLREAASRRAATQLVANRNKIMDVVNQAEAAVRNNVSYTRVSLANPDSIIRVCRAIVRENPVVMGSTVSVVPGYLKDMPLYAPYMYKDKDNHMIVESLATPEYDYPSKEWFTMPLETEEGYWSEPYIDEGISDEIMTTYSVPVKDMAGNLAAVLTADIGLDWLAEMVGKIDIYPDAFYMIVSRQGRIMVSTDKSMVMCKTLDDILEDISDSKNLAPLNRAMLSGQEGSMSVVVNGDKCQALFAPVERTGWSMSILIPNHDIYKDLRRVGTIIIFLQLLGLVMLIFILRSFIKGQLKVKDLDQKRERMESELQIARSIQMSMVPKAFPPFPERRDLDIAAAIVPAKEVGGDLYDYFIRDEKLFFCVGDVSGKGVPASLVMAVTRMSFRNLSAHVDSPGRIVKAMNNSLTSMNENNMFVTLFCGVLDLANGIMRFCNAGHNPPMVLTDTIRELQVKPNLPLGILAGFEYEEQEIPFNFDDALCLYTDGISEAENINHEQFGEERMMEALHGWKSASEHLENIKEQVAAFVGEAPQSDDITILFIHYMPVKHSITLHNDISQIALLPDFIHQTVVESKLDPELEGSLNLAIEEAVTNVIDYAYPEGTAGTVVIDSDVGQDAVTFIISDSGKAFDPTARAEVDINAGLDERPIGGLGIHLVRHIMDKVRYERVGQKNVLILTKKY